MMVEIMCMCPTPGVGTLTIKRPTETKLQYYFSLTSYGGKIMSQTWFIKKLWCLLMFESMCRNFLVKRQELFFRFGSWPCHGPEQLSTDTQTKNDESKCSVKLSCIPSSSLLPHKFAIIILCTKSRSLATQQLMSMM